MRIFRECCGSTHNNDCYKGLWTKWVKIMEERKKKFKPRWRVYYMNQKMATGLPVWRVKKTKLKTTLEVDYNKIMTRLSKTHHCDRIISTISKTSRCDWIINSLTGWNRSKAEIKSSKSVHQAAGVVVEPTLAEAMTMAKPHGAAAGGARGRFASDWADPVKQSLSVIILT